MAITRQDEVLKKAVDTDPYVIPRYDIVNPAGQVESANVQLVLKNEILQEGTFINKKYMDEVLSATGTLEAGADDKSWTLEQEDFVLFDGATIRFFTSDKVKSGSSININGTGYYPLMTQSGSKNDTLKENNWFICIFNASNSSFVLQGSSGGGSIQGRIDDTNINLLKEEAEMIQIFDDPREIIEDKVDSGVTTAQGSYSKCFGKVNNELFCFSFDTGSADLKVRNIDKGIDFTISFTQLVSNRPVKMFVVQSVEEGEFSWLIVATENTTTIIRVDIKAKTGKLIEERDIHFVATAIYREQSFSCNKELLTSDSKFVFRFLNDDLVKKTMNFVGSSCLLKEYKTVLRMNSNGNISLERLDGKTNKNFISGAGDMQYNLLNNDETSSSGTSILSNFEFSGHNDIGIDTVAVGSRFAIILLKDNTLWSVGNNGNGQLGLGDTTLRTTYTKVDLPSQLVNNIKKIQCDNNYTIILTKDGKLWGCGYGNNYPWAYSSTGNHTKFVKSHSDVTSGIKDFYTFGSTTLVISNDNKVYFCGHNYYGRGTGGYGIGSSYNHFIELDKIKPTSQIKDAVIGDFGSMVTEENGAVWCNGTNYNHMFKPSIYSSGSTFVWQLSEISAKQVIILSNTVVYIAFNSNEVYLTEPSNMISGDNDDATPKYFDVEKLFSTSPYFIFKKTNGEYRYVKKFLIGDSFAVKQNGELSRKLDDLSNISSKITLTQSNFYRSTSLLFLQRETPEVKVPILTSFDNILSFTYNTKDHEFNFIIQDGKIIYLRLSLELSVLHYEVLNEPNIVGYFPYENKLLGIQSKDGIHYLCDLTSYPEVAKLNQIPLTHLTDISSTDESSSVLYDITNDKLNIVVFSTKNKEYKNHPYTLTNFKNLFFAPKEGYYKIIAVGGGGLGDISHGGGSGYLMIGTEFLNEGETVKIQVGKRQEAKGAVAGSSIFKSIEAKGGKDSDGGYFGGKGGSKGNAGGAGGYDLTEYGGDGMNYFENSATRTSIPPIASKLAGTSDLTGFNSAGKGYGAGGAATEDGKDYGNDGVVVVIY